MPSISLALTLQGIDRATGTISRVGSALRQLATAAAGALSVRQIAAAANEMSALTDAAARVGATASGLASMQQAFARIGLGAEAVDNVLLAMRRNIADKSGVATLERMGLAAQELLALPAEQQFARIGAAIASIADPVERTRAEVELFGRSGAQLDALFGRADFAAAWRDVIAATATATDAQLAAGDKLADALRMLGAQGKAAFFGLLGDAITFFSGASDGADVALPLIVERFRWWARVIAQRIGDVLAVFAQLWDRLSTGWRDVLAWMGRGLWDAVRAWGDLLAQLGKNLWRLLTEGEWDSGALRERWRATVEAMKPDFRAIGIQLAWTEVEALDDVLARKREELVAASRAADAFGSAARTTSEGTAPATPAARGTASSYADLVLGGTYAAMKAARGVGSDDAASIAKRQLERQTELVELARRQTRVLEALEATA